MVQTVITAAGLSSSIFLASGFSKPKNLVEVEGRQVLFRAIDSYVTNPNETGIAILKSEQDEFDTASLLKLTFPGIRVVEIPFETQGALISALLSLEGFEPHKPLVVAAGDSEIRGGISQYLSKWLKSGVSAATLGFESNESRWSYVRTDLGSSISEVAERKVIGRFATTGVFYFRTMEMFLEAASWCLVNNARTNQHFYVSTTLNYVIHQGERVELTVIGRSDYISYSLPIDFVRNRVGQ